MLNQAEISGDSSGGHCVECWGWGSITLGRLLAGAGCCWLLFISVGKIAFLSRGDISHISATLVNKGALFCSPQVRDWGQCLLMVKLMFKAAVGFLNHLQFDQLYADSSNIHH